MSQKQINKMIPHALEAVEVFVENKEVQSKYHSAMASFGVSVLQSGIHATYLFYDAKGNNDKRKTLPNIINFLIGKEDNFIDNHKEDILDACTALKLAIRTYKKGDNKEAQDE